MLEEGIHSTDQERRTTEIVSDCQMFCYTGIFRSGETFLLFLGTYDCP